MIMDWTQKLDLSNLFPTYAGQTNTVAWYTDPYGRMYVPDGGGRLSTVTGNQTASGAYGSGSQDYATYDANTGDSLGVKNLPYGDPNMLRNIAMGTAAVGGAALAGGLAGGGMAGGGNAAFDAGLAGGGSDWATLGMSGGMVDPAVMTSGLAGGAGGAGGAAGGLTAGGVGSALASGAGALKTGTNLAGLVGAAAGALSSSKAQGGTSTVNREPWGPTQDWLKNQITYGQQLQDQYKATPFSPDQQKYSQAMYGLVDRMNGPQGLLANAVYSRDKSNDPQGNMGLLNYFIARSRGQA